MTRQEIIIGVKCLDMIPRTNPTLSGLRIVINALKDFADEAKKIGEIELCELLNEKAAQLRAHLTAASGAVTGSGNNGGGK